MRALFALLLLANIVFAGWWFVQQRFTDSPVVQEGAVADSPVRIVLLREQRAQQLAQKQEKEQATTVRERTSELDSTRAATAAPATGSEAVSDSRDQIALKVVQAAAGVGDAVGSDASAEACFTLGPFRDLEKLRAVTRDIRDQVIEASFRSAEERERSLFQVFLQPEADLKSAKSTTRMLWNKNFRDFYIITEGKNRFGVSLGHFRDKSLAYNLRDRVAKAGFNVVVEPVFRTYTLYWLDFRADSAQQVPALLKNSELTPSVNFFNRACH